jgi:hypothetical protein
MVWLPASISLVNGDTSIVPEASGIVIVRGAVRARPSNSGW